jgi:hypothetical protein
VHGLCGVVHSYIGFSKQGRLLSVHLAAHYFHEVFSAQLILNRAVLTQAAFLFLTLNTESAFLWTIRRGKKPFEVEVPLAFNISL